MISVTSFRLQGSSDLYFYQCGLVVGFIVIFIYQTLYQLAHKLPNMYPFELNDCSLIHLNLNFWISKIKVLIKIFSSNMIFYTFQFLFSLTHQHFLSSLFSPSLFSSNDAINVSIHHILCSTYEICLIKHTVLCIHKLKIDSLF